MCPFKIEEYRFVTIDKTGKIGSIYFPNGRIRFIHTHGPEVVENKDIVQEIYFQREKSSLVKVDDLAKTINMVNISSLIESYKKLIVDHSRIEPVVKHLFETIKDVGNVVISDVVKIVQCAAENSHLNETRHGKAYHKSRGIPVKYPLKMDQTQLDHLYKIAGKCQKEINQQIKAQNDIFYTEAKTYFENVLHTSTEYIK